MEETPFYSYFYEFFQKLFSKALLWYDIQKTASVSCVQFDEYEHMYTPVKP